MVRHRAVITGLGVVAPNGTGTEPFWQANLEGRSGIGALDCFDASVFDCRIAGQVRDFDPAQFIPPQTVKRTDRFVHLGLAAAKMALQDSGLELGAEDRSRAGVIAGSGLGGPELQRMPRAQEMEFTIMRSEIELAITGIIADELGVDTARVTPEARLREDLGADSINAVQIAWEIEQRFKIEIPETDLQNARTVAQIVDYVLERVRERVPQAP